MELRNEELLEAGLVEKAEAAEAAAEDLEKCIIQPKQEPYAGAELGKIVLTQEILENFRYLRSQAEISKKQL